VARHLDRDQLRLYELIWLRFVAGQMASAVYDTTTVDFDLTGRTARQYLFRATGSIVKFDGFTRLYQEAREEGDHRTLDDLVPLPPLAKGEQCKLLKLTPAQHFTQPPPRFTEASLVKELERLGIGRPSTYAQIISTIVDREYVKLEQKRFQPTPLGETVVKVLIRIFPSIFNVRFTSEMEAELDRVEEGELAWRQVLDEFYEPFQRQLEEGEKAGDALVREAVSAEEAVCPNCGKPMVVRWNRYGRFLGCSGYPECRQTAPIDQKEKREPRPIGEQCPNCQSELVEREGRFGPFIACSNYPTCKYTRPKALPDLKCPKCGEGEIAEKRTRRGKPFWGCTRYPECDWSSWDKPVKGPCPECASEILVERSTKTRGDYIKCPKCNNEFTRSEDGSLEHAASPRTSKPVRARKTGSDRAKSGQVGSEPKEPKAAAPKRSRAKKSKVDAD
jgi:DNA topoisomerase-1